MNSPIKNTTKLDQLTSLRFFAALMIVFHHSIGLFGIEKFGVSLGQGVSFFFVLSGFILAYVYPSLDSWCQIRKFWWARIARIWPAHLACLFLGFLLIPYSFEFKTFLANLFLVQSWIPLSKYYFSYNAVSWSISSELFFYLAFPFLLSGWCKGWWAKFSIAVLLLVLIILGSNALKLPSYGHPGVGVGGMLVSEHGLIYISPLSRIFEFVCGMCIAAIFKRRRPNTSYLLATAYEVGAILLCAFSMFNINYLIRLSHDLMLGTSMEMWLAHCGSFLAFGILIYVVAHGRGFISKILATPGLVLLGEISFSIYLIHQILLIKYKQNALNFSDLQDGFAFSIYILTVMLAAYLIWFFVEMPGRRLLLGFVNNHGVAARSSWRDSNLVLRGKPLLAVIGLFCIFGFLNLTAIKTTQGAASKLTPISLAEAESMTSATMREYLGVNFKNSFTVRGLDFKCTREGLYVYVAWQITSAQDFVFTNAVHLINKTGTILSQADYKQSPEVRSLVVGSAWLDTIFIPKNKLLQDTTSLALGIYDDAKKLLLVDKGPTDWGGRRLIIPIDNCSSSGTNSK